MYSESKKWADRDSVTSGTIVKVGPVNVVFDRPSRVKPTDDWTPKPTKVKTSKKNFVGARVVRGRTVHCVIG